MPSLSGHAVRFLVELGQRSGVGTMRAFAQAMTDGVIAEVDGRPCLEVQSEVANVSGTSWPHRREWTVPGETTGREHLRLFP